ncbi:hypothetical protein ACFL0Y_02415 [Patescibacteria group bacterium]
MSLKEIQTNQLLTAEPIEAGSEDIVSFPTGKNNQWIDAIFEAATDQLRLQLEELNLTPDPS